MPTSPLELLLLPLGRALRSHRSGVEHSVLSRPGWTASATITVTSESFEHGGRLAEKHSALARGDNVSPPLSWTGVPDAAAELLLVIEDLDFPFDRPGLHTIGLVPPSVGSFAEGALTPDADVRWIPTRGGRTGYAGPRPLPGHGRHHYSFHVLALDAPVPASAALPDIAALDPFVAGHVLALGTLVGHQDSARPSRG